MSQILIQINDDYLSLVPRQSKDEYRTLKESIQTSGQREPIVINNDGIILDGHTRFEICQDLGIPPKLRIEKFDSKEEERLYVIQSNLIRRQLNAFQKIELCYTDYKNLKKKAEQNTANNGKKIENKIGSVNQVMGYRLGLNHNTIRYAIAILESGDSKTIAKVRNGTISINLGYHIISPKNRRIVKSNQMPVSIILRYFENDVIRYPILEECVRLFNENVKDKLDNFSGKLNQRCRTNHHGNCKNAKGHCECPCHVGVLQ